jgi:putative endonuclease
LQRVDFMDHSHHLALGAWGEDLAEARLRRDGYEILQRRYRTRAGEIDIVAIDGRCLVFVEVKTREGVEHGTPAEAVTPRKQRRIAAMASDFLARHRFAGLDCRFDVVAVTVVDGRARVEVIRHAFDAS